VRPPEYLRKRGNRWRRMARLRLGNEIRERTYWKEETKRRCRLCEKERKHRNICERCRDWKEREGAGKRR